MGIDENQDVPLCVTKSKPSKRATVFYPHLAAAALNRQM